MLDVVDSVVVDDVMHSGKGSNFSALQFGAAFVVVVCVAVTRTHFATTSQTTTSI